MIPKPHNHVTEALKANRTAQYVPVFPEVDEKLLVALEAAYPPRCKVPGEELEAHAFYAGKANLVEHLRFEADLRRSAAVDETELDDGALPADAERAS